MTIRTPLYMADTGKFQKMGDQDTIPSSMVSWSNPSVGVFADVAPTINDNGGGTVTVGATTVALASSISVGAQISKYQIAAATFSIPPDSQTYYICAKYSNGAAAYYLEVLEGNINARTITPVYACWNMLGVISSQYFGSNGDLLPNKIDYAQVDTVPYRRSISGGLIISENSLVWSATASTVYAGTTPLQVSAITANATNLIKAYHVSGTWTYSAGSATYDNAKYDNGTNLVSVGGNKYAVRWIFRSVSSPAQLLYVLGLTSYANYDSAAAELMRTDLPEVISKHCILIGKAIIRSGASAGVTISTFDVSFAGGAISSDHNALGGIYGDAPFYHLSQPAYTEINNITALSGAGLLKLTAGVPSIDSTAYWWASNHPTTLSGYGIASTDTLFDTKYLGINANAASASKLATARTIAMSGDGTWSTSFDGSANATGTLTLATLLTAGSAGSATTVPTLTWDAKGRLTAAGSAAISIPHTQISDWAASVSGFQPTLGFTPVQQGGGTSMGGNKVYIGWGTDSVLRLQVDATNFGSTWPINITGSCSNANNANTLGGNSPAYYATASSLSNYLPLAGGTLTGALHISSTGYLDLLGGIWLIDGSGNAQLNSLTLLGDLHASSYNASFSTIGVAGLATLGSISTGTIHCGGLYGAKLEGSALCLDYSGDTHYNALIYAGKKSGSSTCVAYIQGSDGYGYYEALGFFTPTGTNLGFLKADGSTDYTTYLTANQAITLKGAVTGSGTTSIATSFANTHLAGINQDLTTTSSPTFTTVYGNVSGTGTSSFYGVTIAGGGSLTVNGTSTFNYASTFYQRLTAQNISAWSIVPTTTAVYDLGSSSLVWNNVYANNFVGAFSGNISGNATTATTADAVAWTGITSKPTGMDNRGAARLYRGDAPDGYWLSHSWSSVCTPYFGSNSWYLTASNSVNDSQGGIHTVLVDYAGLSVNSQQLGGIAASSYLLSSSLVWVGGNNYSWTGFTGCNSTTWSGYMQSSTETLIGALSGGSISLAVAQTRVLTISGSLVSTTLPLTVAGLITANGGISGNLTGHASLDIPLTGSSAITGALVSSASATFGQASLGTWAPYSTLAWFGAAGQNNNTNGNSGFLQYTGGNVFMCAPSGTIAEIQYNGNGYLRVNSSGVTIFQGAPLLAVAPPSTFTGLITATGGISGNLTGHASLDIPLTGSVAVTGSIQTTQGLYAASGMVGMYSMYDNIFTIGNNAHNIQVNNTTGETNFIGLTSVGMQGSLTVSGTFTPAVNRQSSNYTITLADQGKMIVSIYTLSLPSFSAGTNVGFWCLVNWHVGGSGSVFGPTTSGTAWNLRGQVITVRTNTPFTGVVSWDGYTWYAG